MKLRQRIPIAATHFVVVAGLTACNGASPVAPAVPFAASTSRTAAACAVHRLFVEYKITELRVQPEMSRARCERRNIFAARELSPQIVTFDVPGSANAGACGQDQLYDICGTQGIAINDGGTVAGVYLNTRLVLRAFTRSSGGVYQTFQAPGAGTRADYNQGSEAVNLTNTGIAGGFYVDRNYVYHAFIRQRGGSFLTYEAPYASQIPNASRFQGTSLGSINAGLDTAGTFFDSQGLGHGFIRYHNGRYSKINPRGAAQSTVCSTDCLTHASATGTYFDGAGNAHGYIRISNGRYIAVDAPRGAATYSFGINDDGVTAGAFLNSSGVIWSYVRYRSGRFVTFQAPGASKTSGSGTQAGAINDGGTVAGAYVDASGEVHGFVRSSSGRFSQFDPEGSIGTFPESVNASGEVTGVWYDSQGVNHGFVWMPR